jgi:hypothetical protein
MLLQQKSNDVVFGSTSWKTFSEKLLSEYEQRCGEHPDYEEMLNTLVGDFLRDIKERRHLV